MSPNIKGFLAVAASVLASLAVVLYLGFWKWTVCRIEVPAGKSLLVRYKGPWPFGGVAQAADGILVKLDKNGRPERVGILEEMPGPGRHFYSPLEYEVKEVEDITIKPGQIGLVTAKVGKDLPSGTYVADEGYKGIQRKLLTPGRYRINPYGYEVEPKALSACVGSSGGVKYSEGSSTLIPPGYVGVVTIKQPRPGESPGIQPDVLQPGIYYINPAEKRVDVVSIGYNETSLQVEMARNPDKSVKFTPRPSPTPGTEALAPKIHPDPIYLEGHGIQFPSADAFEIHMDFTAIWGILPDQAPAVVANFGEMKSVEDNVILPQIKAISRLQGSRRGAVDLLVGDTREAFQTDTAEELDRVLTAKGLKLLFGLTRHIYVPAQVREPIQQGKIAEELKKTREQEQLTQRAAADLAEAKKKVLYEERRTEVETEKMVAEALAGGSKKAAEITAETERLTAKIDAESAQVQAQITRTTREAEAKKVELASQAKAELSKNQVQMLGGPEAFNRYMFAENLPTDIRLGIFYAGPGTFWTDLKGFEQILTGKLVADQAQPSPAGPTAIPASLPKSTDRR
ncbi:MAG: SPFH domain-containing protein [Isosphaeraceae bacterium]